MNKSMQNNLNLLKPMAKKCIHGSYDTDSCKKCIRNKKEPEIRFKNRMCYKCREPWGEFKHRHRV